MLCTNEPYNENDDIAISKTSCYNYVLTNKSICEQAVTVQLLTADTTQPITSYTLPSLGSLAIVLPKDGIYSIKGTGTCTYLEVSDDKTGVPDIQHIAVFEFPFLSGALPITLVRDTTQGVNAYDAGLDGASSLNTPANLLAALTAYGVGTGFVYHAEVAAPSNSFTGTWSNVYSGTDGWRLLVAYVGTEIDRVVQNGQNYTPVARACGYYINTAPYDYITQIVVDGVEQMVSPQYYDLTEQAGVDAFTSTIGTALSNFGTPFTLSETYFVGGVVLDQAECPIISMTQANGEEVPHVIQWCTTFFEFCALWNCVQKKLAEWLCCNDPCAPGCNNAPHGDEWLDMVLTLTMWGMAPLLNEHHLWQFGKLQDDMGSNLERLQPTILLWQRWYKMVENCGCPQTNGCSPCSGGGLLIPQSPVVQPVGTNTGGCGCG